MGSGRCDLGEEIRVLIIGCGFLGSHIACGLARRGATVRVLSHSFGPGVARALPKDALIRADASERSVLKRALSGMDEVVYCIGGLQPAEAELHPELDTTLMLTPLREVVAALDDGPGPALTYLSSGGAVYGNPERLPVSEDELPRPIGAYAAVRLKGERIVSMAHENVGLVVRILRCANVYGEHQRIDRGQGAVGVFLERVSRGEPIEVYGDGSVVRDYVYVGDLVEAIARLLGRGRAPMVLNVGSGNGTSLNELIGIIEAAVGRQAITISRPDREFDVRRVVLDVTRMRRLLAVDPITVSEGVALLVGGSRSPAQKAEPKQLALA